MGKRTQITCDWCGATTPLIDEEDLCGVPREPPEGSKYPLPPLPKDPYPNGWMSLVSHHHINDMTTAFSRYHDHEDLCATCAEQYSAFRAETIKLRQARALRIVPVSPIKRS